MLRMCASTSGRCTASTRSRPRMCIGCSEDPAGGRPPAHGASSGSEWIRCTVRSWLLRSFLPMSRAYVRAACKIPADAESPCTGHGLSGIGGSDEQVRPLQVLREVDLDRVQVRDVHGLEQQAVLQDRELEAALEVVLVVDALQLAHEGLLVARGDVVDPDGLADAALDRLGELLDVPLGVDGVLDLLVAHLGGVDGHEGLVALDEGDRAAQDARVEHDVAVHPEHAAAPGGGEAAQQALGGVGLVVALVVHVVHIGEGLDDRLRAVADDRGDADVIAEGRVDVVVLLLHDGASVVELSQRLREGAPEARAHARSENDGLKSHRTAPVTCVHGLVTDGTLLRATSHAIDAA
ncbi:exported hypothetical protein [Microbacterium sp. 8M]|nr:exported hypothetical protein [Microbacterium sp. 8M]